MAQLVLPPVWFHLDEKHVSCWLTLLSDTRRLTAAQSVPFCLHECEFISASGSTGKAGLRESAPHPSGSSSVSQMQMRLDLLCLFSHLQKTTTWQDPRLSQLQSATVQHQIPCAPVHTHSFSNPAPTTQPQPISSETGSTWC